MWNYCVDGSSGYLSFLQLEIQVEFITEELPGKCHVPKIGNKLSNNFAINYSSLKAFDKIFSSYMVLNIN